MLKDNPASLVQAPKASFRKIDVDESKIVLLMEATRGSRLEVPIMLAAMTGFVGASCSLSDGAESTSRGTAWWSRKLLRKQSSSVCASKHQSRGKSELSH
jgi:hypothetical protein